MRHVLSVYVLTYIIEFVSDLTMELNCSSCLFVQLDTCFVYTSSGHLNLRVQNGTRGRMCMKHSNWSTTIVECISCNKVLLFVTDICGLNLEPRLTHQKSVL